MSEHPEVTLEMDSLGNQFLHLVLPADKINFLNGMNSASDTFFQGFNTDDRSEYEGHSGGFQEPMMIEVGCKVFEVNRIAYRQHPTKFNIETSIV